MRRILLLVALAAPFAVNAASFKGMVVAVSDGDTITVTTDQPCEPGSSCFKGQKAHRIRLAEIDAPERKQPYGLEAKTALAESVLGRQVIVEDLGQRSYTRIVAHIYQGKRWVNMDLVASGNAWVDPRYSRTRELMLSEKSARQMKLGIWSQPVSQQIPPWQWRKQVK
ncbi:thermonuclease family protein [Aquipseudomonas alcaligenes]|jgi:endonuclease YncB( thermonuclease family)|uniref:Endonuclease YncB, thermonuclease family n=1 Tax=Aquipseudomonas alcaligenes TaxID=43263 RepID=A0A1N6X963_AQUAC|nr:thermonuclease family protein [Pseudomonas alcaligenes]SIQ98809.1 Endonuclease YncB, thermonuclease family [Pseudomonas alcaligenes]